MLPRDADAAVQLRALLQDLGGVVAEVRRRRADDLDRLGVVVLHRAHRELGDAVAALDPHLHVGDAVLDRLVRRQRSSERAAVAEVLERELEHAVEPADHLRALQHDGEVQLTLDGVGGTTDLADDPVGGHLHVLEVHGGEAPYQVDRVDRLDVHARRRRRDQALRERAVGAGGHEQLVGLRRVLDRRALAVEHEATAGRVTAHVAPTATPWASQPPPGPAMHHAATISPATMPGQHLGPQLGRSAARDRVGDDVGGHERSGRHEPSHLLGHDGEVDDALTREAAATVVLRDEERRPPELGTAGPPGPVEPVGIVGEGAHRGERRLLLEELAGRLLEELLVVGEAEVHRRRA